MTLCEENICTHGILYTVRKRHKGKRMRCLIEDGEEKTESEDKETRKRMGEGV